MTGLLLFVVNVVIGNTLFKCVTRNAGTSARAEVRPVRDPENVIVSNLSEKDYEAFPADNVMSQGFVGGYGGSRVGSVLRERYRNRNRQVWGKDTHVGSLVWMPNAEVPYVGGLPFPQDSSDEFGLYLSGRGSSAVRYLNLGWYKRPGKDEIIRTLYGYPGPLVKVAGGLLFLHSLPSEGRGVFRSIRGTVTRATLPESDESIGNYSPERKFFPKQFLVFTSPIYRALGCVLGGIFMSLGVALFNKTLRWVCFDGSMNMNIGTLLAVLSAVLFWIGQWCLFSVLGLFP